MKKLLLIGALLFGTSAVYGQSYCSDNQGILVPDLVAQTVSTTGGYYEFSATAGCTYVFSHCNNGGSYTGDPYLRVTDLTNNLLGSNDDFCGLGSQLTWTAATTEMVKIHLGVCCGGTGAAPVMCSGGPSRVLAYWSTNCAACVGTTTPTVTPVADQCASGSFTLNASSPDPLDWFDTPNTALPPIGSGASYTTPTITSTTSYWVAPYSVANGCYGAPVEVICVIDQVDNITFSNQDTILCELGDTVQLFPSSTGGTISGIGSTVTGFDPSIGPGNYWIYYDLGDVCGSNDSIEFVVQTPIVEPSVGGCPGDSLTLASTGGPGISWFDDVYGSNMLDTGDVYTFLMDTAVSYFYAAGSGTGTFYIDTVTNTNSTVLDHNSNTGDDRGGVAITHDWFYVVGDNNSARIDPGFTGVWETLPQRDGIISNLDNGMLYTLWNGTSDINAWSLPFNFSHLAPMDDMLVIDGAGAIALSSPINITSHSIMGAGKDFMILWNGGDQTFYKINYNSGFVEVLGTGNPPYAGSESWADWGVAEVLPSGDYAITYRTWSGGGQLERFNITQGTQSVVVDFGAVGGISDLTSFTVAPWSNQFFFHHEGSSGAFGGSSETGGFSDANIICTPGFQGCPTEIPVTVNPLPTVSLGNDVIICENDPVTLDGGAGMTAYNWSTGETTQTIDVNTDGPVWVTITNSSGCTDSDTMNVTVLPMVDVNLGPDMTVCSQQLFTLNAGGGYSIYTWNTGGNSQTITENANFLPLGLNQYTVTVIAANGCLSTDTIDVTIQDCASLEELNGMNVSIYPNPTSDMTTIDLSQIESEVSSVKVIDWFGKTVKSFEPETSIIEMNVSDLATGVYIVEVTTDSQTGKLYLNVTK
jgi:hypothetical protein